MAVHSRPYISRPQTPGDLAPLGSFVEEVFGYLPRADQRRWAHAYLAGLLSTQGKKTVRRLAAAVTPSPTASQSLYQFVNSSPWDWGPALRHLAHWSLRRSTPRAWTVGTAVVPKRGDRSVGVHRRFDPASGRTVNCQVGVGIFLSTDSGPVPLGWRILLPARWSDDPDLRERTRIPRTSMVSERSPSGQVLDLVHTLHARTTATPLPVVADMSDGAEAVSLIRGLGRIGCDFIVAVPGTLPVVPGGHLRSEGASVPRTLAPVPVQRLLQTPDGYGDARGQRPHVALLQLPGHAGPAAGEPQYTYRAFTEHDAAERPHDRVWITNLTHRPEHLLTLTGLQSCTTTAVRTLESDFGLRDFEGRSFPGWHHHMTLVSAAYGFDRLAGWSHPQLRFVGRLSA